MKVVKLSALIVMITIFMVACQKANVEVIPYSVTPAVPTSIKNRILVDASKDGGTWWFPQSPATGFSASNPHQGKAIVDYLRTQGFIVDELPRGTVITADLLKSYTRIIRSPAFFNYTASEVAAYNEFLKNNGALLLSSDHLKYTQNDLLCEQLGVHFAGAAYGTISQISAHEITKGVAYIPFIAGSAIVTDIKSNLTTLGRLGAKEYADLNNNGVYDQTDILAPPVLGILYHPNAKIVCIADINGLEQVPQPFTANLFRWLFE